MVSKLMNVEFFSHPRIKALPLEEAFLMAALIFNPFCPRSGIFKLYTTTLVNQIGEDKFLKESDREEIQIILNTKALTDKKRAQEEKSLRESMASRRVKDMLHDLEEKGLVEYDFDHQILKIVNIHDFIPLVKGRAQIIAREYLTNINSVEHPAFWAKYCEKYKPTIQEFFANAEKVSANAKTPSSRGLISDPTYVQLKQTFLLK